MRIVIDLQGAQTESRFRGIGRYSLSLARAIVRNRGDHEILIALSGLFPETIGPIREAFEGLLPQENIRIWHALAPVRECESGNEWRRRASEKIREAFLASLQPDLIYVSSMFEGFVDDAVTSLGRITSRIPTVVTLYDLIPLLNPEKYFVLNSKYKEYYRCKLEHFRQAAGFLAISQSSAQEGLQALSLSEEVVCNISTACDSIFQKKIVEPGVLLSRLGVSKPFILNTGGGDERKNLLRLVQAFSGLPENLKKEFQLVLAGKFPEETQRNLSELVLASGLCPNDCVFTGYISDDDLVTLYNTCSLFVFPSWHEGFGLPPLEAMSCGAPVIGANTSSLPEVIGWEEALFNPFDVHDMTRKIERALIDEIFRQRLLENAERQSRKFSWDDSARKALGFFQSCRERFMKSEEANRKPSLAYVSCVTLNREAVTERSAKLLCALSVFYDLIVIVDNYDSVDPWISLYCTVRDVRWLEMNLETVDRVIYCFDTPPFNDPELQFLNKTPGILSLQDMLFRSAQDREEYSERLFSGWISEMYCSSPLGADGISFDRLIGVLAPSLEFKRPVKEWHGEYAANLIGLLPLLVPPEELAKHCFESIEHLYADALKRPVRLLQYVSPMRRRLASEAEWTEIIRVVSRNCPYCPAIRQLFLDISELVQRDSATGGQCAARSCLKALLQSPPPEFRIEPVYATVDEGYRYARQFTANFLGLASSKEPFSDDPIKWRRGDIFFGLDMQRHVQLAHRSFYRRMRMDGVVVKFLVYDLLPLQLPESFRDESATEQHEQWLELVSATDGILCMSKMIADAYCDWLKKEGVVTAPGFQITHIQNGENIDASNLWAESVNAIKIRIIGENGLEDAESFAPLKRLPEKISWLVEGPFDSSYSLALVNRETAKALSVLGHDVALHSTEGFGDFTPQEAFLNKNEEISVLYQRSMFLNQEKADVTSRNLYPPRVSDMRGKINLLHHYAWEESGIPFEWVQNFNHFLQGITALSRHVEKILVDNGVAIPLKTSGCGVDHWEKIKRNSGFFISAKPFRFLHVSSCFPRKGADVLLDAYGKAFTADDDVSLVIKTFSNPHNEVFLWLKEAQRRCPSYPDVIIINNDLSDGELKALYEQCHVLVAPSRAEGFGLPLAEAMLSGLAVITTGWSGQTDFCNEETSWLIDYTFAYAKSHFNLFDSVWAEPDVAHLAKTMKHVYSLHDEERKKRSIAGRKFLLGNFRWTDVASRLVSFTRDSSEESRINKKLRVGWISTWNVRCGIAAYSAHLLNEMPDDDVVIFANRITHEEKEDKKNVFRCWKMDGRDDLRELTETVQDLCPDVLVIQLNYGFFDFSCFCHFMKNIVKSKKIFVIELHSTQDPPNAPGKKLSKLIPVLKKCHRVLVHSVFDMNRLKGYGLVENVTLFPLGMISLPTTQSAQKKSCKHDFLISSYGFFLPHKGLLELIDSIRILRANGLQVRLQMVNAEYPAPESQMVIQSAKNQIEQSDLDDYVFLKTEFLDDAVSLDLLAKSDLVVFPYQKTGESASAAVRFGIASGCPVAVTPLSIFEDVAPAVFQLPGTSPEEIALGIAKLLDEINANSSSFREKMDRVRAWRESHQFRCLGRRLSGMLRGLVSGV